MSKMKNKLKMQPLALITSIVGVVLIIGAYFIGYNVGQNAPSHSNSGGLIGAYSRTYYNQYNVNVVHYITFKDDGSCRYSYPTKTENGNSVDLNNTDEFCSYTYDANNKSGVITIDHYKECVDTVNKNADADRYVEERLSNCKNSKPNETYNFSYASGTLRVGTNTYTRIK